MKLVHKIWHWIRWPVYILLALYIALVLYRIPAVGEKQRTVDTIAKIQAQKITLADVMGDFLPVPPNKEQNDATVEGVDKNNNYIRDDVELAIFKLHPESAKIRAAELQYAMALQLMITEVFNSETWKIAANKYSLADGCLSDNLKKAEIDNLVIDTKLRQTAEDSAFGFTTSVSVPSSDYCDIDLSKLPN